MNVQLAEVVAPYGVEWSVASLDCRILAHL